MKAIERNQRREAAGICRRCPALAKKGSKHCQRCLWTVLEEQIKGRTGVDLETYARAWWAQHGLCAICKTFDFNLVVDHDHKTGAFRALLCNFHNPMLGYANDSIHILEAAIVYLRAHP